MPITEIVKEHIEKNLQDIQAFHNYNKRDFVNRFNTTLMKMAVICQDNGFVDKKTVEDWLMVNYLMSDVAVRRYLKIIKAQKHIFYYDDINKRFYLPESIQKQLENQKNQKEIE